PLRHRRNGGLGLELGPGGVLVEAPIAPGYYQPIAVRDHRRTRLGEAVIVAGPGVLAFDGERERVLHEGQTAVMRVERSGPCVIDVRRALRRAARQGLFARMKPAEPAPTGDQAHADE
ncbi:MAG: hypothetical protein ACO3JL_21760, partial [Myxococcota bacterium]